MKKNKTITTVILATILLFSCGKNEGVNKNVTIQENNASLQEIKIGDQTWATTNLNVSRFRNGDEIPEAKTSKEWDKAGADGKPAWCYYDNDSANGKKYGKLYNWYAVTDVRDLAPKGWHVPTDAEWTILTDNLGGEEVAGTKIKSKSGWIENGNGTNTSGFAGLPGGYRTDDEEFDFIGIGKSNGWWSSTESSATKAWHRGLIYILGSVGRNDNNKCMGYSVRCVKD